MEVLLIILLAALGVAILKCIIDFILSTGLILLLIAAVAVAGYLYFTECKSWNYFRQACKKVPFRHMIGIWKTENHT